MSYDESLRSISLNADASLAVVTGVPGTPGAANPNYGFMYRFVKVTGVGQVGLSTAGADDSVGVMQNKPQVTGMAATVAIAGVTNIMSGGAVTAGQKVESDSTGRAITLAAGKAKGIALATTTGANQLVPVLLLLNG
jgi:hypothetical protein